MDDRPLDVNQVMDDLRDRAARVDPRVPLFAMPDASGQAGIVLRDTTPQSPRAVVGTGITKAKRGAVRAVWPVLHDLVEQINAALLEFRYVEDRLDALEQVLDERARVDDDVENLREELHALRHRVAGLEDVALDARIARLEAGTPTPVQPVRAGDVPPVDPAVAALAAERGRIDDLGDERLGAYRALLDPSAPDLDLSWTGAADDPLSPLAAAAPSSLGGVIALGLGDHLEGEQWLALARMAAEAIRPGGGLVLEMINPTTPAGLALRSRDPSLAPPVHPETVEFILRTAGFPDVEVRYLGEFPPEMRAPITPDPDWFDARLNEMASLVNDLVVGQPLVAVIARR